MNEIKTETKTEITLICYDEDGDKVGQVVVGLGQSRGLPFGTALVRVMAVTERRVVA